MIIGLIFGTLIGYCLHQYITKDDVKNALRSYDSKMQRMEDNFLFQSKRKEAIIKDLKERLNKYE